MNWASENHEEALQLFKQSISYYCEDEDITDPGKIALKIPRVRDVRCRQEEA